MSSSPYCGSMRPLAGRIVVTAGLLGALLAPQPSLAADAHVIRVPQDIPDVQDAVDAAGPGDLILLDRGIYPGGVEVPASMRDLTIRGVDRNEVVFDGQGQTLNAIEVEGDGVTLENMTADGFAGNGFYWDGVDGFVGRYLTVYNVGLYGIYALESRDGLIERSYVSGAADAAFYVGECQPCDTVLRDLTAVLSAVGYSGTNAGGNLVLRDSRWTDNGVGIMPNSYDTGQEPPPQREMTVTGNVVEGSGTKETPVNTPLGGFVGVGIAIAGGADDLIEDNVVTESARFGIAVFSTLGLEGRWDPAGNVVRGNQVDGSGEADLALAAGAGAGNCFAGNTAGSSMPTDLDGPSCPGAEVEGSPQVAEALVGPPPVLLDLHPELQAAPGFETMPVPPPQPDMPGAERVPGTGPWFVVRGLAVTVILGAGMVVAGLLWRGGGAVARRLVTASGGLVLATGVVGVVLDAGLA